MPKVVSKSSRRSVDCPIFEPEEMNYLHWRKEVEIWRQVTTYPKSKQGSYVYLALRGTAKDSVFQMKKELLELKDGFEKILAVLDDIYMPAIFQMKYRTFYELRNCTREPNDPVIKWAVEWHAKYLNYESVAGVLPSESAAMMFITAANLTADQRQSIRLHVGTDITYAKVREIIKIQFAAEDKEENKDGFETFFNGKDDLRSRSGHETLWGRDDRRYGERSYRGDYRSRYYDNVERASYRNDNRKRQYDNEDEDDENYKMRHMNPTRNGRTMTCNFCGSKFHFRRFCMEYANMQNDRNDRKKTEKKYAFNY